MVITDKMAMKSEITMFRTRTFLSVGFNCSI